MTLQPIFWRQRLWLFCRGILQRVVNLVRTAFFGGFTFLAGSLPCPSGEGGPWENGFCELFNSKLRDEFVNSEIFHSMKEIKVLAERWRIHYNSVRPHSSLGYRPPAPQARAASSLGSGQARCSRCIRAETQTMASGEGDCIPPSCIWGSGVRNWASGSRARGVVISIIRLFI